MGSDDLAIQVIEGCLQTLATISESNKKYGQSCKILDHDSKVNTQIPKTLKSFEDNVLITASGLQMILACL